VRYQCGAGVPPRGLGFCDGQWFTKKDHIVPFIDKHWGALCTGRARTATWWSTVGTSLSTDTGELFTWFVRPPAIAGPGRARPTR